MKYKTYEDVLMAEDYISAMKEFLKDKGMTLTDWACSEEGRKYEAESTRIRMTTPYPEKYFPSPAPLKSTTKKKETEE